MKSSVHCYALVYNRHMILPRPFKTALSFDSGSSVTPGAVAVRCIAMGYVLYKCIRTRMFIISIYHPVAHSGYPLNMTVHHRTGHRSSAMADVITYRLEDKMVYVPLNSSWTVRLHCFCTPF